MGHARPILVYLCSFQTQILQKNTVGFGGIQIRIIGVEGEHADHMTTTTMVLPDIKLTLLPRLQHGLVDEFIQYYSKRNTKPVNI